MSDEWNRQVEVLVPAIIEKEDGSQARGVVLVEVGPIFFNEGDKTVGETVYGSHIMVINEPQELK